MNNKHNHHQCEHEIAYCKVCDVCYCKKCNKEWGRNIWYWNHPNWSTVGNKDSSEVQITYASHAHTGEITNDPRSYT